MKEPYPVGTKVIAAPRTRSSGIRSTEIVDVHKSFQWTRKPDTIPEGAEIRRGLVSRTGVYFWLPEFGYTYSLKGLSVDRTPDEFYVQTLYCESCGEERLQHECVVHCGPCGEKLQ